MRASSSAHDLVVLDEQTPETVAKAFLAKALRS